MGHDDDMTLDITVRGSAEQRHPAERAIVSMAAAVEGPDAAAGLPGRRRDPRAAGVAAPRAGRASRRRPVVERSGARLQPPPMGRRRQARRRRCTSRACRSARSSSTSSGSADSSTSGRAPTASRSAASRWDVGVKNRRSYEAETRKAAVDDAVAKAQSYANAVRRGKVVAVQLADPGMLTRSRRERRADPDDGQGRLRRRRPTVARSSTSRRPRSSSTSTWTPASSPNEALVEEQDLDEREHADHQDHRAQHGRRQAAADAGAEVATDQAAATDQRRRSSSRSGPTRRP